MAEPTRPKRRSPISREEGERKMIEATLDLIREKPFSEVGVRDIAKRADINHGFVHVWFGSKHLLFMAARNHLMELIITRYANEIGGPRLSALSDPDSRLLVRLAIWLEVEGVEGIEMPISSPLLTAVSTRLQDEYNMDPEVAKDAGRLAIALSVGHLALEKTFNWGDSVKDVRTTWNEVLKLLANSHPA